MHLGRIKPNKRFNENATNNQAHEVIFLLIQSNSSEGTLIEFLCAEKDKVFHETMFN